MDIVPSIIVVPELETFVDPLDVLLSVPRPGRTFIIELRNA